MKFISLFSGIGGFDLAFERAGMECISVCEIDKSAQAILRRHFPNATLYDDVRKVGKETHEPKSIDLICGGFPCQDLSVAGKRAGLAGERSGLWFEFARVIDELEPRWVVIENVPGLLSSHKGKDFAIIVRWLAERGYGVTWRVLDAQYFGVPQRRRRVFIVGSFGNGSATEVLFEREGVPGNFEESREAGQVASTLFASDAGTSRPAGTASETGFLVAQPLRAGRQFSDMGDGQSNVVVSYGLNSRNNRLDGESQTFIVEQNNIVSTPDMISLRSDPAQPVIFQQNTRDEVRLLGGDGQIAGALASQAGMKQQNYIAFMAGQGAKAGSVAANEKISPTLKGSPSGSNRTPSIASLFGVRRLTPNECERLQGFPDGWTDGQSDSARYRQLGNAVAVPVVEWIGKRIMKAETCLTQHAPDVAKAAVQKGVLHKNRSGKRAGVA